MQLERPDDARRAADAGRRLGEWSWRATAAAPRTLIAAALAAAIWHAAVPAMAFGAYLTAIVGLRLMTRPAECLIAAARRARSARLYRERK